MALSRHPATRLTLPILLACSPLGAQAPSLRPPDGQRPLAMESLDIQVQVVGNLVTTTWDMTFRNSQARVIEGELVFPLSEGQTVSRYAVPVNGVLREGVVVPKAKGREAFEAVVRRPTRVDPGLLEKTEGNAFRTRIYPIPANGTYRVVLAYEQELNPAPGGLRHYRLPLAFQDRVGSFTLRLDVADQGARPWFKWGLPDLVFQQQEHAWRAEHRAQGVLLDKTLDLALPAAANHQSLFMHTEGAVRHFYTHLDLPARREPKPRPSRLLVVWDASASASRRDLGREREVLGRYLQTLGTVHVSVAVLRHDMEALRTFQVTQGRAGDLLRFLEALPLDGGTRFDALRLADQHPDEVLLFSDGLGNLGSQEVTWPKAPLVAIQSSTLANPSLLRAWAEGSGGEVVNLQGLAVGAALDRLRTQPLAFLGFDGAPGDIHDVHPARGTVVQGAFGLAGLQVTDAPKLTLKFGYGNRVAFTRDVVLQSDQARQHPLARRMWAQKKLADLSLDPLANREAILALGQSCGLVTDETSLIVLESVDDYVRFRIPPPPELRAEYDQRLAAADRQKDQGQEAHLTDLASRWAERKAWWSTAFKVPEPVKPAPAPPSPQPAALGSAVSGSPATHLPVRTPAPTATTGVITGTVSDPSHTPLAQATVTLVSEQITRTTLTAADGSFRVGLLAPGTWRLEVIKSGFQRVRQFMTVTANRTHPVTVRMAGEAEAVVEVVSGAVAEDATTTQSGMNVSADQLRSIPVGRDIRGMAFLSPGVTDSGGFGRSAIGGGSSAENSYVLDGLNVSSTQGTNAPSGRIQIAAWNTDRPYLAALRETPAAQRYEAYLTLRKAYAEAPGFYLDVCDFFEEGKDHAHAVRLLTNLAELGLDHPGLLRTLGHRLLQMGERDLAIQVFRRVLRLREEEPQSLRDLALAEAEAGHTQRAAEGLYQVATSIWDPRFADVDVIALNELNALIAKSPVDTKAFDARLLGALPVDIRVVLSWDTNDSDMDLHVTDPRGEVCMYNHARTAIGGRISRDCTQGYGPEEFLLRAALPGTYRIEANYYGTRQQTAVVGPTTLKAVLFLHYGTPQETRKEILLRLDGRGQLLSVGTFEFAP